MIGASLVFWCRAHQCGSLLSVGWACAARPPLRPAFFAKSLSRAKLLLVGLTLRPPLRPASAANSAFCEKLLFSRGTLSPPFLAMARCFSGSIEAKPRFGFFARSIINILISRNDGIVHTIRLQRAKAASAAFNPFTNS